MCFSLSLICVSSVCLCVVFGVRLLLCTVLKALVVRERLGAPVWRWRRTPPPPGGGDVSGRSHCASVATATATMFKTLLETLSAPAYEGRVSRRIRLFFACCDL